MRSEKLDLEIAIFGEAHMQRGGEWFCPLSPFSIDVHLLLEKIFKRTTRQVEFYLEVPSIKVVERHQQLAQVSRGALSLLDVYLHFAHCFERGSLPSTCGYPLVRFHTVDIRDSMSEAYGSAFGQIEQDISQTFASVRSAIGSMAQYIDYVHSVRYDERSELRRWPSAPITPSPEDDDTSGMGPLGSSAAST
jgi:hypothetical protein